MEKRDLYLVGTQLQHGTPGSQDMQPFDEVDLGSFYSGVLGEAKAYADAQDTALIAAASTALVETVTATATADGTGTGAITSTAKRVLVNVSSDNADKIVKLPAVGAAHKGIQVIFQPATTGYELRTTSPTTTPINGGTGSDAESAIPANTLVICTCIGGPGWICTNYAADGTVSATEPAAAP